MRRSVIRRLHRGWPSLQTGTILRQHRPQVAAAQCKYSTAGSADLSSQTRWSYISYKRIRALPPLVHLTCWPFQLDNLVSCLKLKTYIHLVQPLPTKVSAHHPLVVFLLPQLYCLKNSLPNGQQVFQLLVSPLLQLINIWSNQMTRQWNIGHLLKD